MKTHSEAEKPQGAEGAWFGNGKQGFKKKHNNKQRGQDQNTAGEFFKGFGFSMGPHGPEMYQKKYIKWVCTQVCSSKIGHNNLPTRGKAS